MHITLFLSIIRCSLHQSPGQSPTIHLSHSNSISSPHKRDHSQSSAAWSLAQRQFSLVGLSPLLPSFSDILFFGTCWKHNETGETSVYNISTNQTAKIDFFLANKRGLYTKMADLVVVTLGGV